MGIQEIGLEMQGIMVGMQGIRLEMQEIGLEMQGIMVGMQGIGVEMRGISVRIFV